ncbi:MAG: helix-turn-helix transcriptional regulator [Desulfovibrionaceae bacterium]|nr:helix-turn-helix transcriptional regulator [Desulfovibrionaceae bacterium]
MITSNVKKIMESKKVSVRRMMEYTGLASETILRARGEQIIHCHLRTLELMAQYLGCKTKDLYEEEEVI